jgi:hypothetical protein
MGCAATGESTGIGMQYSAPASTTGQPTVTFVHVARRIEADVDDLVVNHIEAASDASLDPPPESERPGKDGCLADDPVGPELGYHTFPPIA